MRLRDKLEIGVACAIVPLALQLCSAARVLRWIERAPRRRRAEVPHARAALHVDRLLHRAPALWRHTCLRRAATLALLLRRGGHDATVVIGVRRPPGGTLEAHAWLRCDGVEPYLEPGGGNVARYSRLNRA